jgi:hypothetical protein
MVTAFVIIGMGTTCMYISAVTTCAKNFGRGKYRGLALAAPIAAFGLSGMWLSQIGEKALYERLPGGKKGDVDVFKFFLFLAITLLAVGLLGTLLLKIVDEDELIDEAVEELERSGLLEDSEFFRRANGDGRYGSLDQRLDDDGEEARRIEEAKAREEEEARKKTWLLNEETRQFVKDHTMWSLAAGFFFISGTLLVVMSPEPQLTIRRSWRGFHHQSRYHNQDFISTCDESYRGTDICRNTCFHSCDNIDCSSTPVRQPDRSSGSSLRRPSLPIRKQFLSFFTTPKRTIHSLTRHLLDRIWTPTVSWTGDLGIRIYPKSR